MVCVSERDIKREFVCACMIAKSEKIKILTPRTVFVLYTCMQ